MKATNRLSIPAFERLLIATDFSAASQSAFHTALDVCIELQASLVILHVFEYANIAPPESGGEILELHELNDRCYQSLERLCEEAASVGVPCETVLQAGIAAPTILDAIDSRHIDLAILGTSALHGFERLVFGSTAESILRRAACPVLTIGPQVSPAEPAADPPQPIVFATDFHTATIDAIRYAARLSQLTGSPLHCLHVLPRTLEAAGESWIVPEIMSEALMQIATDSGLGHEAPTCATIYGSEISNAIVDYAKQRNARLIVLGVRQASMLAIHLPEHIAYRIITEAPCPVLTMAFGTPAHNAAAVENSISRPPTSIDREPSQPTQQQ